MVKFESCQGCHPAVSDRIQFRSGHHVGERVIVSLHSEGLVLQILSKLFCYHPLKGKEL